MSIIRLLGSLEVDGPPSKRLAGPRQRGILAALALSAGQVVSTGALAAWLWDERLPDRPAAALHTHVSRLRSTLGDAGPAIRSMPGGYALDVARGYVDALHFADLVHDAERQPVPAAEARLREALALWRGPALADIAATEAVLGERTRLEEYRLLALERHNDLRIGRGGGPILIGDLHRLVADFPFRERFVEQLIRCLHQAGRPAEALAVYRAAYLRFRDELAVLPGPALRDLHRTLLGGDEVAVPREPAAETPRPAAVVEVRLLGSVTVRVGDAGPALAGWQLSLLAVLALRAGAVLSTGDLVRALWGTPPPPGAAARIRSLVAAVRRTLAAAGAPGILLTRSPGYQLRLGPGRTDVQAFDRLVAEAAGRPPELAAEGYRQALAMWRGDALEGLRGAFVAAESARLAGAREEARRALDVAAGPRRKVADRARFVGRREEIDRLDAAHAGGSRLVLVVGPAGVGKTALVHEWARRSATRFPDGHLFVDVRGFHTGPPMSPQAILSVLLIALGVATGEIPMTLDGQIALYRSRLSGRRTLIVLDNVADAGQVRPLLPDEPGCLTVITGRDRLSGLVAIEGAQRLSLDVLSPAESVEVLAGLAGGSRIAVDQPAAEELAILCGRLPLALRIAGAQLADRPELGLRPHVEQLTARGAMTQLRVDGDGSATIRGAFDLSYRGLPAETRRVFRLFGLVPAAAGWAVAGLAALAGRPERELEPLVDTLIRLHLVKLGPAGRLVCHDLLLEYASQLAEENGELADRDGAVNRLLAFYLHAADRAATALNGPPRLRLAFDPPPPAVPAVDFADGAQAREWVAAEWPSLVSVLDHAAASGRHRAVWQLTHALRDFMRLQAPAAQWLAIARTGLVAAQRAGDVLGEAAMRHGLGSFRWRSSEFQLAIDEFTTAGALSGRAGWDVGRSVALSNTGIMLAHLGRMGAAVGHFEEALALDRALGDQRGEAAALTNLAAAHEQIGNLSESAGYSELALPLLRRTGQRWGEAIALENIGTVRREQGRLAEAVDGLSRALDIYRGIGARHEEAAALTAIGVAYRDLGRYDEAAAAFDAGIVITRSLTDRHREVFALCGLAGVDILSGRPTSAAARVSAARDLAHRIDDHRGRVEVLLTLAQLSAARHDHDAARDHAGEALALSTGTGHLLAVARAHGLLAVACLGLGDTAGCVAYGRRALEAQRRAGQLLPQARTLLTIGHAYRRSGREQPARSRWRRADRLLAGLDVPERDEVGKLLG